MPWPLPSSTPLAKVTAPTCGSGPAMTYGVLFAGWPPIQLAFSVIVSLVLLATSPAEVPATMRCPSHWLAVQPALLTVRVFAPYVALEPEALMLTGSRSTGLAGAVLRIVVVRLSLLAVAFQ